MKNTILAIILFFTSINVFYSQTNIYPTSGNVGIGTTTPAAKLDIVGDIYIENLDWSTDNALRIREGSSNTYGAFFKYGLNDLLTIGTRDNDLDYTAFQVPRGSTNVIFNGNVGLGTNSPEAKLDVVGDVYIDNIDWQTDNALRIREGSSNIYGAFFKYGLNDLLTIGTRNENIDYVAFQIARGSSSVVFNGNVGIGTTSPAHKLDVIGTIRSREVRVDMNGADFVFEDKYPLMPLTELEAYVKKNKHLPEIATAKEMQEQGSNLGDLNTKLLQKIEELTLYVIEQQKLITQQAKELESHKVMLAKIDQMEKTLAKMNTANEK